MAADERSRGALRGPSLEEGIRRMENEARPRRSRSAALMASGVLFGLYVAYVLVAAFGQKAQATLPLRLEPPKCIAPAESVKSRWCWP